MMSSSIKKHIDNARRKVKRNPLISRLKSPSKKSQFNRKRMKRRVKVTRGEIIADVPRLPYHKNPKGRNKLVHKSPSQRSKANAVGPRTLSSNPHVAAMASDDHTEVVARVKVTDPGLLAPDPKVVMETVHVVSEAEAVAIRAT
jgi:hypothetical protein